VSTRYEFLEHTADILVKAYGDTVEQAFGSAAEAMFAVITDNAPILSRQPISFEVDSVDREGLLVAFLSQLIVIFETENLVATAFSVSLEGKTRLQASAAGEPFKEEIHGGGTQVKGISYHMMEIHEPSPNQPAWIQVLFDI
jgi:SHS2 domain-containing protein